MHGEKKNEAEGKGDESGWREKVKKRVEEKKEEVK